MKIVCIIPARGGSKGIKEKNLQKIGEYSLVEIKVIQALNSIATEVFVSTDHEEIARVSRSAGAKVLIRSIELSSDTASTDDVLVDAAKQLGLQRTDILVLLQATSPLMKQSRINECIQMLSADSSLNSVITVKNGHPFMWKKSRMGFEPDGHSRDYRPRRQELTQSGWETGACYAVRVSALLEFKVRYPFPTGVIDTHFYEAIDIDSWDDLIAARALANLVDLGHIQE